MSHHSINEILDTAITRLQNGESQHAILADYPDHKEELSGLLAISKIGLNIPKLDVPAPYKRHLYSEAVTKGWFWSAVAYYRIAAIPIALVVVLIGGNVLANQTSSSLPGDTLYSLKRATEEARLTFTRDQEKIAVIHVELMQKRLNEVRQAAQSGNAEAETAAIAALQSQSAKTFAQAGPIATANAISKQDSTLLDTLVAVNKQQKDVLTELGDPAASTALNENIKTDQALAKIVATVNDQVLIDAPNKVSVTGNITYFYKNYITVENNTFAMDEQTVITASTGETVDASTIKMPVGRASITGIKTENGVLVAKQISLLPADTGEVKGATTTTKPVVKPKEPAVQPDTTIEPVTDPNQATGSFIVEPSAPQYNQK